MFKLFIQLNLFLFCILPSILRANVVGTDFQLFNPTHDIDQYVTVYSSKSLKKGQMTLGMFVDAAMNTLPYDAPTTETKNIRTGYQDLIIQNDFHLAYGILDWWNIGLSVPLVFQTLKEDKSKVVFDAEGITEVRLSTKVRAFGNDVSGLAFVGILSKNFIRDNPYMGDESNLNYQILGVANMSLSSSFDAAINFGFRKRDPGLPLVVVINNTPQVFPLDPTGDQLIGSLALGYNANENWRFIYELYGANNLDESLMMTYRKQTSIENLIGIRYQSSENMFYYMGAATELVHGVGTADFRFFAGINWTPQVFYKESREIEPPMETPVVPEEMPEEVPEEVPVEPVAPTAEEVPDEQFTANNIYFATNSDRRILRSSREEIARIGEYLKNRGFTRLVIEGHTDSQGSAAYNLQLSKRRAESIKNFLVKNYEFNPTSIFTEGLGLTKPIADNATEEGRRQNRRVEFRIYND